MKHTPPFQDLAFPEFKREFGDFFRVRATADDYDYGMIVGVMSNLFLLHLEAGDREHWEKTVRAAHYYLDHGALKKPREVCEAFMRIADEIPPALSRVTEKQGAARDVAIGDAGIEAYLSLYKTIVEALMAVIAAPVVVGFALHYGSKAKEFIPKPDGRVNLRALESMQNWVLHPSHRLKEGLNSHVRNAYSHERYRILDDERVELWDQDARGRPTWGPEVWTLAQLEGLCHRLYLTALGIVAALALFGMNYRQLIADRGWVPQGVGRRTMRLAHAQQLMESFAEFNSMSITAFERDGQTLRMGLATQHKGVDQGEEIVVGGEGWGRRYRKPVKYEQVLVVEQVLGIIQRAAHNMEDVNRFLVTVKNEDNEAVGEFGITRGVLPNIRGPSGPGVAVDRKHAETDTLGDARMWVRIEGEVSQVVRRGRQPRRSRLIVPS